MLHGGQLREVKKQFPSVINSWLDLSTGINPYPYPFTEIPKDYFSKLPFIEDEEVLKNLVALKYGVNDCNLVAISPGTQILISLLPQLLSIEQVCVYAPTYIEHITCWQDAGVEMHQVSAMDQFISYISQRNTVGVICNPNNPDGHLFTSEQIQEILSYKNTENSYLIIDEAFMDFEGESIANLLPTDGLIILRSFGKTYGMAGIRLGFMLANENIIHKVQKLLGSWSVNGAALYIAQQALQDDQWFEEVKQQLELQLQELRGLFSTYNIEMIGQNHLFQLIKCQNAKNLWGYLASQGILTRKFDYNSTWLRFGLPRKQDWIRVKRVLTNYFINQ